MSARRWFAVPAWTERATLVAIGAWCVLYAATRVLDAVNTAGAQLLPAIATGPSSWRPAQPLGNLPFRLQVPLMRLSPLMLFAFVALGLSSRGHAQRWRRFLILFALADALLLVAAYRALTIGDARTNAMSYAMHQLAVAPFVFMGLTLAWPSRVGRRLAFAGAAILAAVYGTVYWLDGGIASGHWLADPTKMAAFTITRAFLWAIVPGLIGAGILLAARLAPTTPTAAAPAGAPEA